MMDTMNPDEEFAIVKRAPTRRRRDWRPVLATLQAHPGQWHRVAHATTMTRTSLARRYGCRETRESLGDGTYDIYAMWPSDR